MTELYQCPNCGAPARANQHHCDGCGTELPRLSPGAPLPPAVAAATQSAGASEGAQRMRRLASRTRERGPATQAAEAPFAVHDGVPIPRGYETSGLVQQRAKGCIVQVRELTSGRQYLAKFSLQELDHAALDRIQRAGITAVVHIQAHGPIAAPVSHNYRSYLIEEFCSHGSLRQWLDAQPGEARARLEGARRVLSTMAEALAALHALNIWHRDIKPENIVVRSPAPLQVALTDFDLARTADAAQAASTVVGTLPYTAPEVLIEARVGAASDFWSVGMLVMEMLLGEHPLAQFGRRAAMLFHYQRTSLPFDRVADVPLRTLLRGLLTRDADRRWGAREVRAYLAGQQLPEPPEEFRPGQALRQPLKVGEVYADSAATLGLALLKYWHDGERLLEGGELQQWLGSQADEPVLAADIGQILRDRQQSAPARLLAVALRCNPAAPLAVYGYDLSGEGLLGLAIAAFSPQAPEHGAEQRPPTEAIDALYEGRLLELYGRTRDAGQMRQLHERWVAAVEELDRLIGADTRLARQRPPQPWVRGCMLACLLSPGLTQRLRQEVAQRELVRECGWFAALGAPADAAPPMLLYMQLAAPLAQDDVRAQRAALAAERAARRAEWLARRRSLLLVPIYLLLPYQIGGMLVFGGWARLQAIFASDNWLPFKLIEFVVTLLLGAVIYVATLLGHPFVIYAWWGSKDANVLLALFGPTVPSIFLAYLYHRNNR